MYSRLVKRKVAAAWRSLSDQKFDAIPMAENLSFTYIGDHALATEISSADDLRAWLRRLFERFPGLRFEIEDIVVDGPPWAIHTATRYRAVQDGRTLYRGAQFTRIRWGRLAEEFIIPDTQAVARIAPALSSGPP